MDKTRSDVLPGAAVVPSARPRDNYFVRNRESRRLELHFSKAAYQVLAADVQSDIKRNFLWSRRAGAWLSRATNSHYRAEQVARRCGLADAGESGERLSFAEQVEAAVERAEARAERFEDRAADARAESHAAFNSQNVKTLIGLGGEPVKIGHHSERKHRRLIERADRDMGRGVEAYERSQHYAARAEAAARTASQAELGDRAFLARRVRESEVELRRLARLAAAHPANAAYLDRLADVAEELEDKLSFYQGRLDALGGVPHSRDTVRPGDTVVVRHGFVCLVNRVNPKTVTCTVTEGGARGYTMKAAYAEIREHRPAAAALPAAGGVA